LIFQVSDALFQLTALFGTAMLTAYHFAAAPTRFQIVAAINAKPPVTLLAENVQRFRCSAVDILEGATLLTFLNARRFLFLLSSSGHIHFFFLFFLFQYKKWTGFTP
jgi:hypothetical protein